MRKIAIGIVAVAALAACTGTKQEPTTAETVTVTASPTPAASSSVDDILGETGSTLTLVNAGDAKACELMRLAVTREANSPSWIDIVDSASFKAHDYDLQDAIDKAYWTSSDSRAMSRTRGIVRYCDQQGW